MRAWGIVRKCSHTINVEQRALRIDEVPALPDDERCLHCAAGLSAAWEADVAAAKEAQRTQGSGAPLKLNLAMTAARHYRRWAVGGFALRVMAEAAMLSLPFIIRGFVDWLQLADVSDRKGEGYAWAVGLSLAALTVSVCFASSVDATGVGMQRLRTALSIMIFDKVATLPADEAGRLQGRVTGHYANDTAKLKEAMFLMALISSPFVLLANIAALIIIAGPPGLVALGILVLFVPFQTAMSSQMAGVRHAFSQRRDERLQSIADLLHGIRVAKFMGWEASFAARLDAQRDAEVIEMGRMMALRSAVVCASHSLPLILQLAVFGTVYGVTGKLEARTVFPTIAILNQMRALLTSFAMSLGKAVDIHVTLVRIQEFLLMPSMVSYEEFVEAKLQKKEAAEPNSSAGDSSAADEALSVQTTQPVAVGFKPVVDDEPTKSDAPQTQPQQKAAAGDREPIADGPAPDPQRPPTPPPSSSFEPLLQGIDLRLPQGKLIMIVGATGAGKTTLVNFLIGEALVEPGTPADVMRRTEAIAFAPQDAWIANATIRENVAMGQPGSGELDEERYLRALAACHLKDDMALFPAGDKTEIGERGINLSGGQKQRVALARCSYSTRQLVVLDDPLSAVDPHVAQGLFRDFITGPAENGGLAGRTRVLVTHHTRLLKHADVVIAVNDRQIAFVGTYAEFSQTDTKAAVESAIAAVDGSDSAAPSPQGPSAAASPTKTAAAIAALPLTGTSTAAGGDASTGPPLTAFDKTVEEIRATIADKDAGLRRKELDGTLVQAELAEVGGIKVAAVKWYAARAGTLGCLSALVTFTIWRASTVFADVWLATWTSRGDAFGRSYDDDGYMMVFGIVAGAAIILVILRQYSFTKALTTASGNAHMLLARRLLRAPLSFFDTTPSGRILNRFSKDIETMDTAIPEELNFWLSLVFQIGGMYVIIAIAALPIFPICLVAAALFYIISGAYGNALRMLRRLENIARSPAVALVGQTVAGLRSIRPGGILEQTAARHASLTDDMIRSVDAFREVQLWAAVSVGCIAAIVGFSVNICAVVFRSEDALEAVRPSGNLAALAVTYAALLNHFVMYFVVMSAQLSAQFSAIERVREYATELPEESDIYSAASAADADGSAAACGDQVVCVTSAVDAITDAEEAEFVARLNRDGAPVAFEDVCLRYRPKLPLVLRNVSFTAEAGQRVGLVGRTGSGKSTTMLAIFRLVELASGTIWLGGTDIGRVPLATLRSAITIIPQDPVLFVGTVRSNLDPFAQESDEALERALAEVGLSDRLGSDGLAAPVTAKGANFSVGQRQLLCLARALLRHSPVLLLDEATASVDSDTDALIQRTIRGAFKGATVLIIAHRLATVMDCDQIVVLKDGGVLEVGPPADLVAADSGAFAGMVAAQEQADGGDADSH